MAVKEKALLAAPKLVAAFLTTLVLLLLGAPPSTAATEPFGSKFCLSGPAAGQCDFIRGAATSPLDGHLFLVNLRNRRVNEFTAWGEFVKAWGWGVDTGAAALQTCTTESGCQQGLKGTGVGQFADPMGVAVDSAGDVYVSDPTASRVQKFGPAGDFLLMFGGDVIADGAAGTGTVTNGSATVTSVSTSSGAFEVGRPIEATGIEPGTRITALGNGTITLSAPAGPAATGAPTAISSPAGADNVPANEFQTLALGTNTTGGTFTLTFTTPNPSPSSATSAPIPAGASSAEVQSALEALSNIGSGNIGVTGPAGGPWQVEFKGTRFADTDVVELSANASGLTVSTGSKQALLSSAKLGEVCAHAAECRTVPSPGNGNGQFSANWPFTSNLAIGPGDEIYVGDKGRIQEFNTAGVFQQVLPDPDQVLRTGEASAGKTVGSLAVDPASGDIYLAYPNSRGSLEPARPEVFRLDEDSGDLLDTIEVNRPAALAADASGNLYVFDQLRFSGSSGDPLNHGTRILKYDDEGNLIETIAETEIFGPEEIQESVGIATGSFCFNPGENGLYVAARREFIAPTDYVQAYGPSPNPAPNPEECPPPDVPPDLNAQFASEVDTDSANLLAEINPHYFTGTVGTTTYRLQWGTATCIEDEGFEGTCADQQPLPPGAILDSPPTNENVLTDPIVLEGLTPETTYAYRFVVQRDREDPLADPLVWVVLGDETRFATLPEEELLPACPNDASREENEGAGMALRDCRAYELVSPTDKSGGDVQARLNIVPFEARVDQSSLSGDELAFSAYRAFQDPQSAPFSSQYLTERTATEWQTEAISAPQEGEGFINPVIAIDNLYRAFSPDLKEAWMMTDTEPVLGPGGLAGHPNIYRRDNTAATYEACTTALPQLEEFSDAFTTQAPQLQGFSADGELAVFRVENKLTDDASDERRNGPGTRPIYQLYACSLAGSGPATVRLVSKLPDGSASDEENTAGGPANESFQFDQGRTESLSNAVSADGTKVFWTRTSNEIIDAREPGALYVRLNPGAPDTASGQCEESEPDNACTLEISAGPARFWTASDDGSVAIFTEGGDLNEYIVEDDETLPIAEEVIGLLGSSEDASRIYFLSEDEIGGEGEAGEPNLYLHDKLAETTSFIATLSEEDTEDRHFTFGPANPEPAFHTARVTPDGSAVAFMSSDADLASEVAGYDNTDQGSGEPAGEIYRYEVGGEVVCVSCNRSGARPTAREVQNKFLQNNPPRYAASMLPPWLNSLYAPKVLSTDGQRVFFESYESLSLRDTNEKTDVYEWEALGKGSCSEADSAFDPKTGGCLSLITSGKATTDTAFVDASPTGDDVFVRTPTSLVAWDPGAIDIYDARVNGGQPAPPAPPDPEAECEGEACQGPQGPAPAAPEIQTNAPGGGNVKPGAKPRKCPKGKHRVRRKGKSRCVRNRKGRAGKPRRASK